MLKELEALRKIAAFAKQQAEDSGMYENDAFAMIAQTAFNAIGESYGEGEYSDTKEISWEYDIYVANKLCRMVGIK